MSSNAKRMRQTVRFIKPMILMLTILVWLNTAGFLISAIQGKYFLAIASLSAIMSTALARKLMEEMIDEM